MPSLDSLCVICKDQHAPQGYLTECLDNNLTSNSFVVLTSSHTDPRNGITSTKVCHKVHAACYNMLKNSNLTVDFRNVPRIRCPACNGVIDSALPAEDTDHDNLHESIVRVDTARNEILPNDDNTPNTSQNSFLKLFSQFHSNGMQDQLIDPTATDSRMNLCSRISFVAIFAAMAGILWTIVNGLFELISDESNRI